LRPGPTLLSADIQPPIRNAPEEVTISSFRSKFLPAFLGGVFIAAASACIDAPSAPNCTQTVLTQAAKLGDTVVLNTGLRYIDAQGGPGEAVQWCDAVTVHYTAYLANGTRIESTHDLGIPLPFTPGLGDLIDGFEQGVIGMRAGGGLRRLIIPPQLGYGSVEQRNSAGVVVIPANSTLIYDIEALSTQ
jgi:FKBP-type peptidyl-prolyl cis-trans isomerase FkpA